MNATTTTAHRTIRIPITGMTCAACQSRVQRTLQKQPGVNDATVNLILNDATITFDPATTSPEALAGAIRNVGYGADPHDFSNAMVIDNNEAFENGNHGFIISRGFYNVVFTNNKAYSNTYTIDAQDRNAR